MIELTIIAFLVSLNIFLLLKSNDEFLGYRLFLIMNLISFFSPLLFLSSQIEYFSTLRPKSVVVNALESSIYLRTGMFLAFAFLCSLILYKILAKSNVQIKFPLQKKYANTMLSLAPNSLLIQSGILFSLVVITSTSQISLLEDFYTIFYLILGIYFVMNLPYNYEPLRHISLSKSLAFIVFIIATLAPIVLTKNTLAMTRLLPLIVIALYKSKAMNIILVLLAPFVFLLLSFKTLVRDLLWSNSLDLQRFAGLLSETYSPQSFFILINESLFRINQLIPLTLTLQHADVGNIINLRTFFLSFFPSFITEQRIDYMNDFGKIIRIISSNDFTTSVNMNFFVYFTLLGGLVTALIAFVLLTVFIYHLDSRIKYYLKMNLTSMLSIELLSIIFFYSRIFALIDNQPPIFISSFLKVLLVPILLYPFTIKTSKQFSNYTIDIN